MSVGVRCLSATPSWQLPRAPQQQMPQTVHPASTRDGAEAHSKAVCTGGPFPFHTDDMAQRRTND